MEHLAIDLGEKESQICVRASDGQIVEERRCSTAMLSGYLASRPKKRVVVETCSEAFAAVVASALEDARSLQQCRESRRQRLVERREHIPICFRSREAQVYEQQETTDRLEANASAQ